MYNPERVTYFAATDSRGQRTPFGLKARDRDRHMYVIGKTGMGKSTLLENLAIQDMRNGEGLAFIDPHGETADRLLEYVPPERINDVVYFAPFDLDRPIAFNVMEDVGYDKRHLVVSGLMATFKKIWVDAWSARMEYILTNTLLALLEYPDATLLGVNRMYTDKAYRKKVVDNVKDPVVKDFWVKEFAQYTDRFTQEATPAIQNKVGQFTSNPLIRNIIGQPKSSFDMRELMDQKKILIINLSKGQVGDTNMQLLGSMITTRIFLGAMSRADLSGPELAKLPPFYFYVDEFQNFANQTFAEILSEARKYKLNLIIAHQYVEQMEEEVRDAVFGNVGTTVCFRVGPFDAETLETIFLPKFTKEDLVGLGFAQIYLTLMIDGVGSPPFSALTLPRIEAPAQTYKKEVIEASRQTFGNERALIEKTLLDEYMATEDAPAEPAPKKAYTKPSPPRQDAPRVDDRPRASRPPERREQTASQSRPPAPREERPRPPMQRPAPPPEGKSAEDLKAILRSMTTKAESERKMQQVSKAVPLKGALADVLAKSEPKREQKTGPISTPAQAPRAATPQAMPRTPEAPKPPVSKEPFEVPEDKLRAIFQEPR